MRFILYNTLDGENVINKTLADRVSVDIILKRDVVIDTPRITLLNDGVDYSVFNYAEIPDFNRFYFIRGYEQINSRMISLELETDVLETYKASILASHARFKRSIRTGDYLDASIEQKINASIEIYNSNSGFTGDSVMVLTTVGKGGNNG